MIKLNVSKILCIALCIAAFYGCDDDTVAPVETPAPAPPTELRATTLSKSSIQLDWTPSTTSIDEISSYVLSISGRSDTSIISKMTSSYVVAGLSAGTSYTFTLAAKGKNGKLSTAISATGETSADTLPAPLPATNLRALSGDYQTVRLKWNASLSASETSFAHYELIVTPAGGAALPTYIIPPDKTSYEVSGLTEGTQYTFSLRAKNTFEKFSQPVAVQWSPATRMIGIRLYETGSVEGNGIELSSGAVLKENDGARWDIALDTRSINGISSFDIGSPNLLSYSIAGSAKQTIISAKHYQNVTSLDEVFDTDVFSNTSMDAPRVVNFTNATTGFVFFAKTSGGNYAKILVKANNGALLQGTAPNRYIEMDISYQSAPNVPYARTANAEEPAFKTVENSPFKKGK